MASDTDLLLFPPILDFLNTELLNRQQKKTSNLWIYTWAPDEDEDTHYKRTRLIYCKYCITIVYCLKSTTNF